MYLPQPALSNKGQHQTDMEGEVSAKKETSFLTGVLSVV